MSQPPKKSNPNTDKRLVKTIAMEKGMPSDREAENVCLGALISGHGQMNAVADLIIGSDFILEKHRRIFEAMRAISARSGHIDRVTVAAELTARQQLESVDGLTYLISLDEGLPEIPNIASYAEIIRRKSLERQAITRAAALCKGLLLGSISLEDSLAGVESSVSQIRDRLSSTDRKVLSAEEIVQADMGGVFQPWETAPGLPTGFPLLDEKLSGGLLPQHTYCIAAETSKGKTALTASICHNIIRPSMDAEGTITPGSPVLYFTGEMGYATMIHRLAAIRSGRSFYRFRKNWLPADQAKEFRDGIVAVTQMPFYADEAHPVSMAEVDRQSRKFVKEKGVKLIVVDYLQIMDLGQSGDGLVFKEERLAIAHIMIRFVTLAKELNVPLVFLSQFSRAKRGRDKKSRRPELSDLFGASSIENSSHVVLMIYREEFDDPTNESLKDTAEFILRKNRNGPLGTIKARFLPHQMQFIESPD